jgi:hypothetical protein
MVAHFNERLLALQVRLAYGQALNLTTSTGRAMRGQASIAGREKPIRSKNSISLPSPGAVQT